MTHVVFHLSDPDAPDGAPPRGTVLRDPVEVVQADTLDQVRGAVARAEAGARDGLHAAGWISYEAAPAFDPAMTVRPGHTLPLVWFGLFPPDHVSGAPEDGAGGRPGTGTGNAAGEAEAPGRMTLPRWRLELDREEHAAAVAEIRDAIAAGRTYQVNYTARMRAPWTGDARALHERMRRAQGTGYHAFLDTGRHVVLSTTPELFFRTRGRRIVTRPMKGTRPRGRWTAEDRRLRAELAASAKDRAENLMIVDLLRNDLGRVCETGSVTVDALHAIEGYRTVWQMTSTVGGSLPPDTSLLTLLDALFPCGSVTGAPKISTMAEIARLEASPRDVYCGAIGWLRPDGDRLFTVPIRTAWLDRDREEIAYGTGGGVVWDSTPDDEYRELTAKAAVARDPWPPFSLLETLALVDGRFPRRDRHVDRARDSADYFGFADPTPPMQRALDDLARQHPRGRFLARLTLGPDGRTTSRLEPLTDTGAEHPPGPGTSAAPPPRTVTLARQPVDETDRFLFHKTTRRDPYQRARDAAPDHAFDVLLHNRRGELTEFSRGNLVAEIDGRLLTPARSAGLLAGCLRQQLLDEGVIHEAPLHLQDLGRARRLWFINSARGWIQVRTDPSVAGKGGAVPGVP